MRNDTTVVRHATLATCLLVACTLPGCRAREGPRGATGTVPANAHDRYSVVWQGTERGYLAHVPRGARSDLPVLLVLHGGGSDAATMVRFSGLSAFADRARFIAVYPEGSGRLARVRTWNAGRCCAFAMQRNVDDVGYLLAVVDDVIRRYRADASRVFVTGMSNGAMMAHRLGARAPDRIRAIAPVAGGLEIPADSIRAPVPVLHVHGTADDHAPYAGGRGARTQPGNSFASVAATIAAWVRATRAAPRGNLERTVDTVDDGMQVTFSLHAAPTTGADVVLVTVEGGGHTWPGHPAAERLLGTTTRDIDVNEVMWEFFSTLPARRR